MTEAKGKIDKIIDGSAIAAELRAKLKSEIVGLGAARPPCLVTILVGEDPASKIYIRIKGKACAEVGIENRQVNLPAEVTPQVLRETIAEFNADPSVDGILVQSPLPGELREIETEITNLVVPDKDVDGFTFLNNGKLMHRIEDLVACTPKGIVYLLEHEKIPIEGQEVVVINRSNIVGKPLIFLLLDRNATVTVCHSRTRDLPVVTRRADIVVIAIGRANFLTPGMIKDGAVVIDVGTNRVEGKLTGDCDFDAVLPKCGRITPVPGGVGPMTVAMLLRNSVIAWKNHLALH